MVTDQVKIEIKTKLAAIDDYHGTALELGLVRHHMQGYGEGKYEETCEAFNKAIKEAHGSEGNGNGEGGSPLVLFADDLKEKHHEYEWYVDEQRGQLMGSDVYEAR